jgi:hypothetical protein
LPMPNPKQSPTAIPSPSARDIDTAYRGARAVSLTALSFDFESRHDASEPVAPQVAIRLRAERIAQAYEMIDARFARVAEGLFERVSLLYAPGTASPMVGDTPYPSALEGLYAEVRHALGYATYPARMACMDRPEGESEAAWVRASWPSQSPEDERTRFAGLAAAMRAIATPHLRNDLERERRHLIASVRREAEATAAARRRPQELSPTDAREIKLAKFAAHYRELDGEMKAIREALAAEGESVATSTLYNWLRKLDSQWGKGWRTRDPSRPDNSIPIGKSEIADFAGHNGNRRGSD